jgi:hypothetical protein
VNDRSRAPNAPRRLIRITLDLGISVVTLSILVLLYFPIFRGSLAIPGGNLGLEIEILLFFILLIMLSGYCMHDAAALLFGRESAVASSTEEGETE